MFVTHELIIAGFGGQGALSMGQILAYAATIEGREVSWMPSYGPEMRGGTANCIVIVAEKRISSPIVTMFDSAIVLNQPSLDKFLPRVKTGGLVLVEESTVKVPPGSPALEVVRIAAVHEADILGARQVANTVMLGAFLAKRPLVQVESVVKALEKVLPPHRRHLLDMNRRALERGAELAGHSEKLTAGSTA
ncbi:MAG: 2-oxoacid:ferredoxin oxidoreductase subunit gamma [Ignavibacteria bacterium GWA2_55_11]|nr:MAG: 2-oxoacid:ferredoxin oxidoreductase subunit gamma [Ignavibacteria bacterium GWA2_55_11]OGU43656.1 MAG: 2-oxoacid:ferredoxin oxidoreductase subunit gamma [Ignavibacteria bacterium GWC2_56_12]OGU63868.1 MAG: 2-oxoacid:ferredoxin oxidoreductase subunit gamma [Ignavibacteria bacterium RIFCSPHIGHO2_02_FULL_56_12]OGU69044.1 MAG: 2-oxoacid:ferredoxin oxidoreductase subunit gamma [Ignavibacteria bacterium RIFCSPLOWO2_02_FULL_55_14]OGU76424.1 MAG: 2-oxoacid:ferredoxin oxidoreductase subunit gamm